MTKTRLSDIANSSSQQAGVIWTRAYRTIVDTPKKLLTKTTCNEQHYLVSPAGSMTLGDKWKSHTVAVALLAQKDYSIDESSPLYLIIDGNLVSPRLQFNKYSTSKAVYDPSQPDEDEIDINDVLTALDTIESKVTYLKQVKSQRWQQRRSVVRDFMHRVRWPAIILAVILVIGTAIFGACSAISSNDAADRQRDAAYAKSYDAKNLTIKGEAITAGHAAILVNDPEVMASNPPSSTSDTVSHSPRKYGIAANSCISVGHIDTAERIVAATDGPVANVVALVSTTGAVSVCATENAYNNKDTRTTPSYTVIVQAQDNK